MNLFSEVTSIFLTSWPFSISGSYHLDNGRRALIVAVPPVAFGTLLLESVVGGVGTSSGTEGVAELTSFVLRGHASH